MNLNDLTLGETETLSTAFELAMDSITDAIAAAQLLNGQDYDVLLLRGELAAMHALAVKLGAA